MNSRALEPSAAAIVELAESRIVYPKDGSKPLWHGEYTKARNELIARSALYFLNSQRP